MSISIRLPHAPPAGHWSPTQVALVPLARAIWFSWARTMTIDEFSIELHTD
jgi:hypothetical protein